MVVYVDVRAVTSEPDVSDLRPGSFIGMASGRPDHRDADNRDGSHVCAVETSQLGAAGVICCSGWAGRCWFGRFLVVRLLGWRYCALPGIAGFRSKRRSVSLVERLGIISQLVWLRYWGVLTVSAPGDSMRGAHAFISWCCRWRSDLVHGDGDFVCSDLVGLGSVSGLAAYLGHFRRRKTRMPLMR